MAMLPTPAYDINNEQFRTVYNPSEDTFILMDALEADAKVICNSAPLIVAEVGSGSGVISVFVQQVLQMPVCSIATDINLEAAQCTKNTAQLNGLKIDAINCDLLCPFEDRLRGKLDLLLFNPPYVPTPEEEGCSDLERCWAGGKNGRRELDRLLKIVPELLSKNGCFYVVALRSNDIDSLLTHNERLFGKIVLERRCGIEHLYVLKFTRKT